MRQPSCADSSPGSDRIFFAEGVGAAQLHEMAKEVCRSCPLIAECLEMALKAEGARSARSRWGVFGGRTPSERARIARARHSP